MLTKSIPCERYSTFLHNRILETNSNLSLFFILSSEFEWIPRIAPKFLLLLYNGKKSMDNK